MSREMAKNTTNYDDLSAHIHHLLKAGATSEQVIEVIFSAFPEVPAEQKEAWKSECQDRAFQRGFALDLAEWADPDHVFRPDPDLMKTMPIAGVLVNAFTFHGGSEGFEAAVDSGRIQLEKVALGYKSWTYSTHGAIGRCGESVGDTI
jgi:hypothetical protein